jgi:glycosyltransferase involved in cell wall biosynthesis
MGSHCRGHPAPSRARRGTRVLTASVGLGRLPRVAVVTTAAPPSPSGQARVLAQIMVPKCTAAPIYLSDQLNSIEPEGDRYGSYLPLAAPRFLLTHRFAARLPAQLNNYAGLTRTVLTRAMEIARHLRRDPVDVIVGCSGNPFDLPATNLAARWLRLPFVAYLFDDPVYQWERGIYRSFAQFWERVWGRSVELIIVPNETAADDLQRRLPKADIRLVRNPVPLEMFADCRQPAAIAGPPHSGQPWRLLYTGSVYSAQASAFRNLVAALDSLGGRFQLDVHTAQSAADMETHGVIGPNIRHHKQVPQSIALELQRSADILFLPLAFDGPIPEVIRSSAPAKLGEYLAANRPILVHAPADSFVSEFFRRTGAGIVVDRSDPMLLAHALESVADDPQLRERLIAQAQRVAPEFHVDRAREAFWSAIGSIGARQ